MVRVLEQPMQRLLPAPLRRAAEPMGEELLALALEPDHETEIRSVDGRRDHPELGYLGRMPDAASMVAVFDRSAQTFAR